MAAQDSSQVLAELSRMIQSVEDQTVPSTTQSIATGWNDVDQALSGGGTLLEGGLRLGVLHEIYGPLPADPLLASDGPLAAPKPAKVIVQGKSHRLVRQRDLLTGQAGFPPLCTLIHLARQAATQVRGETMWIGRRCWPSAQILSATGLLDRSLFVDAVKPSDRLWAIEVAMRSGEAAAVIGDAEGFNISATRRLELAARESQALTLLARPGEERAAPSAATTRWAVYRRRSSSTHPAWTLELLRCKGRPLPQNVRWLLEWDCVQNAVIIPAAVVDRRVLPAPASLPQQRVVG
jgi:hypothetical protein